MPIPKRITDYLNKNKVKYEVLAHRTVFTAYDLANTLKKKLNEITKTLMIKADKDYILVVLPASKRLDLKKIKKFLKAKKVEICKEGLMKKVFKVKPGAITPFGSLHKTSVLVDKTLVKTNEVIMGAGSFTESLRLKIKDYLKLEEAKLGSFGEKADLKLPSGSPKTSKKKSKK